MIPPDVGPFASEASIIKGFPKMKYPLVVSMMVSIMFWPGCKKDDVGTNPPTGTISGTVIDAYSSAPLSGASLTTSPPTSAVLTAASGKYTIASVNPGAYSVTASRSGYTSGVVNVMVTAGGTATGNIPLALVNSPPNQPSNPTPSDNAFNQSKSPTLSWTCSDPEGDPLTYDVYFGSDNPPLTKVASNLSATTLGRSGLSNSTTYYWRVNAKDNKGAIATGTVWSFITVSGVIPHGMILVQGGTFQMGSTSGLTDEQPVHAVTLRTFYLDAKEVTYLEYDIFCKAKGRSTPGAWGGGECPDLQYDH